MGRTMHTMGVRSKRSFAYVGGSGGQFLAIVVLMSNAVVFRTSPLIQYVSVI